MCGEARQGHVEGTPRPEQVDEANETLRQGLAELSAIRVPANAALHELPPDTIRAIGDIVGKVQAACVKRAAAKGDCLDNDTPA